MPPMRCILTRHVCQQFLRKFPNGKLFHLTKLPQKKQIFLHNICVNLLFSKLNITSDAAASMTFVFSAYYYFMAVTVAFYFKHTTFGNNFLHGAVRDG